MKVWDLPMPPTFDKEEYIWRPAVQRYGTVIPFGYRLDPEDPQQLLPIPEELAALEEAKKHLKTYSYKKVRDWLVETTGREISVAGLRGRVKNDKRFASKSKIADYYAKQAKEFQKKAERLQNKGRGPVTDYDRDYLQGGSGTDTISGGRSEGPGDYLSTEPGTTD